MTVSLLETIRGLQPTSYWPLDEAAGSPTVRDDKNLHTGAVGPGVTLGAVPFGSGRAPFFNGELGSLIKIPDDEKYSHTFQNAITVAAWICPSLLDFRHTQGKDDQYVHFLERAKGRNVGVEWAMRLLNQKSTLPSRMSYYLFNSISPPGLGAGAYMQCGVSQNDHAEIKVGDWYFAVGQGEPWIDGYSTETGAIFFKQGVQAERTGGDKYNNPRWNVRPHHALAEIAIGGSIDASAFEGSIAHVAIWNRLLTPAEVDQIWCAGVSELKAPTAV